MNQQQEQNQTSGSNIYVAQPPSTDQEEVKKMNINPNPRANENLSGEDAAEDSDTSGVGSEITDGESS